MAAKLADVAARAGVSPATVSRVLNGNYPVAHATAEKVHRAVAELHYVVNGNARALVSARSDLVGVLVHDIADPFFGVIASGIQDSVAEADVLAVVCNTGSSAARELSYLKLLRKQRARAVVLTGGSVDDPDLHGAFVEQLTELTASGAHVVLCGRPPVTDAEGRDVPGLVTVDFDNRDGARRLTAHLTSLGHREIGYVTGPEGRTTSQLRLEGHLMAIRDAGLDEARCPVVSGRFDRASGSTGATELLRRNPDLTAVVAGNDMAGVGVLTELRSRGIEVPRDISVAGFDDLPFSSDTVPALTTVRIPLTEAGRTSGRLALGNESPPPGGLLPVRTELLVRDSTAPPSRGRNSTSGERAPSAKAAE
ncbi:LacI family DNA-binding transcriptional regulator [Nocardiopsis sp. HNM0947]|uniref:LacI family DNA-binding transcriptional regulator n=1 Tax=Nocardiopsis coralli TaxID=2772213 RepID=A0ABR9P146_9ACTN|nr:LacI family DNA-binding transcriptional regulator [Nocardiopsis coralli]MBE2997540.1 LacI family DNA-binding transcriptional regulator [Nocardiopsis coralli]